MKRDAQQRRAAIYTRISRDAEGRELGVGRQEADCRALADRLGLEVVAVYGDNDVSASTSSTKARPSYDALIEAVRSGEIDAVLAYSLSRITRRPREWEDLIDLHRATGVTIHTLASGDPDLSTADGRAVARTIAAWDAAEAERTSERIRRQRAERTPSALASSGPFYGGRHRPYGFLRDGTVIDDEAEVVREVFRRYVAGESASAITLDLQRRGLTGTAGVGWTNAATRRVLRQQFYVSRGIIDEATYAAAARRFQKRPSVATRKNLLGGVLVCAVCHGPLVSTGNASTSPKGKRTGAYTCDKANQGGCGKVRIMRHLIDPLVVGYVASVLGTNPDAPTPQQPDLQPEIEALDERREQVKAAMADGTIDYRDGLDLLAQIKATRADLVASQAVEVPTGIEALWTAQSDAVRAFLEADVSLQTATVRRFIAAIEVSPVERRGQRFDPRRLSVVLTNGVRLEGEAFYALAGIEED